MSAAPVTVPAAPGFFGKLPARGDFVSRGLPPSLLTPWDQWLQAALAASRQQLGDQWLDHYLTSPLWRLALSGGACGPQPYSGVLMPSVDRVGRYYPLLLAAPVADGADLLALTAAAWFATAEQLALQALADDLDLDQFAAQVAALGSPPMTPQPAAAEPLAWQVALTDLSDLSQIGQVLAGPLLGRWATGHSLWWTAGSDRIAPCLLLCQGLPPPERFTGLLTGDWPQAGWQGVGGYT